jgi:cytochrome b561
MPAVPQTTSTAAPRFQRGRFDQLTIAIHWTTVALVTALFAIAWSLDSIDDEETGKLMLTIHRSLGAGLWALTLFRLTWRRTKAWLPPFPPTMPTLQQWAAKASEYALYALLLVQPLTGLAMSFAQGHPFVLAGLEVPAVMARDKALAHQLHDIHELGADALLAVIGLHATAGLFHRFVLRDSVLQAMLPWTRQVGR